MRTGVQGFRVLGFRGVSRCKLDAKGVSGFGYSVATTKQQSCVGNLELRMSPHEPRCQMPECQDLPPAAAPPEDDEHSDGWEVERGACFLVGFGFYRRFLGFLLEGFLGWQLKCRDRS